MSETRSLSITLRADLADLVEAKVASGHYASESEVIEDSLLSLRDREAEFENWLRQEVVPAYEAHLADPSRAIPIEEVMARLDARIAADRRDEERGL